MGAALASFHEQASESLERECEVTLAPQNQLLTKEEGL